MGTGCLPPSFPGIYPPPPSCPPPPSDRHSAPLRLVYCSAGLSGADEYSGVEGWWWDETGVTFRSHQRTKVSFSTPEVRMPTVAMCMLGVTFVGIFKCDKNERLIAKNSRVRIIPACSHTGYNSCQKCHLVSLFWYLCFHWVVLGVNVWSGSRQLHWLWFLCFGYIYMEYNQTIWRGKFLYPVYRCFKMFK